MIKVACAEESSLDFFLKNQPELTKDILTPEDWKWLQKFDNFLGKFEAYTLENEGYQGDIARSLTTLLVIGFDIKVEKLELDRKQRKVYDPSSRRILTNLFQNVSERDLYARYDAMLAAQQKWFNELYDNPLYLMAILLHPKYRKDFLEGVLRKAFNEQHDSKSIFEKLRTLWIEWASEYDYVQRQKGQSSEGRQTRRRTLIEGAKQVTIDDMAQKILGTWVNADDEDEFDRFLREPATQDDSALEWWLHPTRQKQWPRLSVFAISLFSFPPMSDEPERVFSGGRRQISWERNRLTPDVVEASECVHHALKVNESYDDRDNT